MTRFLSNVWKNTQVQLIYTLYIDIHVTYMQHSHHNAYITVYRVPFFNKIDLILCYRAFICHGRKTTCWKCLIMHITRWRNVNAATQQYRLTMMKQHAELYYRLPVPITQKFPYRWQPRCVDDDNGNRGTVPVARNRYTLSILLWQIKAIKTDNLIILKHKLNFHQESHEQIMYIFQWVFGCGDEWW